MASLPSHQKGSSVTDNRAIDLLNLDGIVKHVTILNSPVLTEFGSYRMTPISNDVAARLVQENGFRSAIGHDATAAAVSAALGIDCPAARIEYRQSVGDRALVFRLNRRMPEGEVVRSLEQLQAIGYSWALIERIA